MTERTLDEKILGADFLFLDQNRVDRDALMTLYSLEVITREDAIKYTQAEEALASRLQTRLSPVSTRPGLDDCLSGCTTVAIAGAFAGCIVGIIASAFSSPYTSGESGFFPFVFGLGGSIIAGAAAGVRKYFKIKKKYLSDLEKASDENLQEAYQDYFSNLDNLWEKIGPRRTKKGDLGEALQTVRNYVKMVRKRFK